MSGRKVDLAIAGFEGSRALPPRMVMDMAKNLEETGVVDYIEGYDVLESWWPPSLWNPQDIPGAEVIPDVDSWHDPWILLGLGAAATNLGVVMCGTNSVRNGPAELMRTMMTLAALTDGKAICMIGAGEPYNSTSFGYKRKEGLARLEDHFRLFHEFWNNDRPFNFEGNHWKIRNAYLGTVKNYRPQYWAMGAGPKLIDIGARYADGFMTAVPLAFSRPDEYAKLVKDIKDKVESHGRDPEKFGFGIAATPLMHEDPDEIQRVLDKPLLQWFAAAYGRFNQKEWARESETPVFPENWHAALHMFPNEFPEEEVKRITSAVPKSMVYKSFVTGAPKEVAANLNDYVEAGANFILVMDFMPTVLPFDQMPEALARSVEVCRILKGKA